MLSETIIDVRSLTKKIKDRIVLSDITLQIHRGAVFGYLGPNGAGKTTTLRILLGLLRPTSGSVRVMGQEPMHFDRARKTRIGVVLEKHGLYEQLTALQNLDFFAHIYRLSNKRRVLHIEHLLRMVGLWEVRNERVGTFSNGMKKRLALARAFLNSPDILFLDEPTTGLDPEAMVMVRNLIQEMAEVERCTVFLNSHDLSEVERICSHVAILRKGKILAQGPMDALKVQYQKPIFEIRLGNPDDVRVLGELLASFPLEYETYGERCLVKLDGNIQQLHILQALSQRGIFVEEARVMSQKLEDFYLSVIRENDHVE